MHCVMYVGFGDRLLQEIKKLTPKDIKIRVRLMYMDLYAVCAIGTCSLASYPVVSLIHAVMKWALLFTG